MNMINQFDYNPTSRVVFGVQSVLNLGNHIKAFKCNNVLIVTDPGI